MFTKKTIIDAKENKFFKSLEGLVNYKDLFFTMSQREFKVRYSNTILGFLWAIIQPVLTLLILTLVFGKLINVETGNIPHLVFTTSGVCIWSFFSFTLSSSSTSLIASQNMIKKIYFPRIIIPISKAIVGGVDLLISLIILGVLFAFHGLHMSQNIFYAPIFILLAIIFSISVGILTSALVIRFRDFQYVIPIVVQLGLYITPIAYPSNFAREKLPIWAGDLYFLNPMTSIIEGFRWSLFNTTFTLKECIMSYLLIFVIFFVSLFYFSKVEYKMADLS